MRQVSSQAGKSDQVLWSSRGENPQVEDMVWKPKWQYFTLLVGQHCMSPQIWCTRHHLPVTFSICPECKREVPRAGRSPMPYSRGLLSRAVLDPQNSQLSPAQLCPITWVHPRGVPAACHTILQTCAHPGTRCLLSFSPFTWCRKSCCTHWDSRTLRGLPMWDAIILDIFIQLNRNVNVSNKYLCQISKEWTMYSLTDKRDCFWTWSLPLGCRTMPF